GVAPARFRGPPADAGRPRTRPTHRTRTRSAAPDRARLHVSGDRHPPAPVGEDDREPRVVRAPQTPTPQPPPTHRLGQRTPHRLSAPASLPDRKATVDAHDGAGREAGRR